MDHMRAWPVPNARMLRPALLAGRYFLHNWPKLCWLAFDGDHCFGVVVCKADDHRGSLRGYIAMLVVKDDYRGLGIGEQDVMV